jgi:amino acid adenylation domain-containing protein
MVVIEFRSPLRKKARLTYCELNRRANKLAHRLIGLGVGPDVLVGVCVERSLDMIVALLGILKAGGAYVPLDPSYPGERLAFMMSDAALSIVVTERASRLPQDNTKLVYVDSDAIAGEPEHNPAARATANALAYVIYTSGSTGKPKGVMIEHGALANLLHAMREHTAIAEKDWWLAVTTLSFDIAAAELYLPLITGAKLVLVGREMSMDGEALSRCLSNRITLMQATPSTWRLLIEAGWKGSRTLRVLCGGEALSRELADQLLARCASLSNLYGPTETTIWSSAAKIHANRPISIGRPLANTEMYVLDDALNPVPVGVPGELHIGGAGLARGYLNRPELTREKFVANPFHPHTRLYKTGDLARYRADGEIEFLGRIDHQIKLRGYRIEPGEIEACLAQHAKITEAAVTAREDRPGDRRLVAYVVPRDAESPPSMSELRQTLKTRLPDYMLPSSFVVIDKLPLTPNGKLDRKALPAPDRLDAGASQVAPRTPLEAQLAAIFATVLQIKSVGARDNFFDLGGHSFLVLRVLAEIEKAFGQRLSVATLFQAATVEEIAKSLAAENSHESSDVIVPLNPRGTTPPLFSVWMGISTELRSLSRCLGPEQRMYGINSHWDPTKMRMTRIEEMAAYYLTHLRKIQPHGPYYLSSDCVSTLTALEMAQQLSAQGEEVRALILIDPPLPRSGSAPAPGASDRYRDLIMGYRDRLRRFMLSQRNSSRAQQLTALSSRIMHALWGMLALPVYVALKKPLPRTLLSRYIFDTHLQARDNYVAKDYAGPVWFIWAIEEMGDARRRRMQEAWSEIARQATHYTVPSSHADLFQKPHVALLADKMKLCLDEARASTTPPPRRKAQRRVAGNSLPVSPLAVRARRR